MTIWGLPEDVENEIATSLEEAYEDGYAAGRCDAFEDVLALLRAQGHGQNCGCPPCLLLGKPAQPPRPALQTGNCR